jgi:hypothetical protein
VAGGSDSRQAEGLASTAQMQVKRPRLQQGDGHRGADDESSEEDSDVGLVPASAPHGQETEDADDVTTGADKQAKDTAFQEGLTFNMLTRRGGLKVEVRKGDLE